MGVLASDRARSYGGANPTQVAATASLLLAVHPMMSQAVGYISARSELMCATFLLVAFLFGRRFLLGGGARWLIPMAIAWVLALSAKEVAAMLPFLLIAYDHILLKGDAGRRRRSWRFLHVPLLRRHDPGSGGSVVWVLVSIVLAPSVDGRLVLVAVDAIRRYLLLLIRPVDQTLFHVLPPIESAFSPAALVAFGVLGVVAAAAWWGRRFDTLVPFGIVWFVLLLLPSSALFVLGRGEALAEHRVYIASIGIFLVAGSMVEWLLTRWPRPSRIFRAVVFVALFVTIAQLAARTMIRNAIWARPVTLWSEAVKREPTHWLPRLMLGEALRERFGCAAAEPEYRRAIALRLVEVAPYEKLGGCLVELERLPEAARCFRN